MYTQVFDPVSDSLGLSSIFAALPLLVLFVLIGVVRMAAQWAALIGLSVALLVAIVIYDMPLGQALDSGLEGAAFGLFPIMWIVVNAIWIYTMTVESGHFNVLRRSFASVSDDQRIQAVIIAFCFGALIEALAGFGTPVAISAVMLLALGLQPIKAASVALVANTAPVAFGAIAIPIITLAGVTELPVDDLGAMVGRQTPLLALIVPLILIGMVDGKRGIRQAWPAAVVCGVSFALAQFVCSNYISVELTDVVASLLSAGAVVALLQVWQPSEPLIGEQGGPRPAIAGAATEDGKFEEMVHRRSDATHDTRLDIVEAYAPYAIIIAVLSLAQIGFVKDALAEPTQLFDWPGLDIRNPDGEPISSVTYNFNWLGATGTLMFISGVLTAVALRLDPRHALRAYAATLKQLKWAIVTVAAVLGLAYVMNQSGQTATLGLWLAGAGSAFAFLSAALGWLGVAITGSDTSSNALFGALQVTAAKDAGLSPTLMAAANSSGGVLGKMISPQNLAIGAAAVGLAGKEGDVFRKRARLEPRLAAGHVRDRPAAVHGSLRLDGGGRIGGGRAASTAPSAQVAVETDVVLRDGSTMHVRPSTVEDVPRLHAFLAALSEESRWFRFFSAGVNLDAAARSAAAPDEGLSLIALRGSEGTVVAHGTYVCDAPGRAEVAFAVADAWHGHGIATVLLAHLAHAASTAGVETFTATVLSANHRMLGVFHESGFLISARRSEDEIQIEFPTSLSRDARRRFEERQREADVAAVEHVLRPSSVAVIGASRRLGTVGGEVVRNLIAAGFSGSLHLVNVHGGDVAGRPTVRSIGDVEGEVELAVIVVPANAVVDVARACAAKGVRALVVLTAGFAELGPAGRARQDELLAVCRAAGMRMVGPNSLGVASPRPDIALNATVAPAAPSPGDVAFASQSGGFGSAAIDAAAARGIGFSSFVTMGDKADLSGSDFLEYWEQDPDTAVLLLYLDSFGNPRRFGRVARRITTAKPIVAVKSARTAGRRAPSSRTGALLAAADVTVDALFAHAGVLRAETVGEMFDVAGLLARQPLPPGDRVAVLTNARGPGIACEDACQAAGLRVQPLSDATRTRLAEGLGAEASTANPVDMTASATADQYERSLRVLLDDEAVDAVVTVFVRPLAARAAAVARGIAAAAQAAARPVLAVWLGADAPAAADAGVVPRFTHARGGGAGAGPCGSARSSPDGAARPAVRAGRRRHRDRRDDRRRGPGARGRVVGARGRRAPAVLLGHPGGGEPAGRLRTGRRPGRRRAGRAYRAERGGAGAHQQERRGSGAARAGAGRRP